MTATAREVVLLANETAGRWRSLRTHWAVADRLRAGGIDVHEVVCHDVAEVRARLRPHLAAGVDGVVAMGGDGTVHHALQAVAGTSTRLGIVPTGTGNDTARALGIPVDDPLRAADVVVANRTRSIDAARAGDRWFVTVLAAGFDAVVNERANQMRWPRGQTRYSMATVAELRTFSPIRYVLDLDGESVELDAMLVAVGNGPSFGGGLRITEGAELDDGLLDVVVIRPMGKLELVRTYPKLFKGTHVGHPKYEHHRVRQVTVAAADVVAYADGERFAPLPLTVECVPGAVEVWA